MSLIIVRSETFQTTLVFILPYPTKDFLTVNKFFSQWVPVWLVCPGTQNH